MSWIPAAITAVQLGAELYDTYADDYVNEELDDLMGRKESGNLGLTSAERAAYEQQYMAPAQAAARESQMRIEGQLAAQGGQKAGQLQRQSALAAQGEAGRRQQAGAMIAQQDLAAQERNLGRLESMVAYKGQREADILDTASKLVGDLGKSYGAAEGGYMAYEDKLKPQVVDALMEADPDQFPTRAAAEKALEGRTLEEIEASLLDAETESGQDYYLRG